MPDAPGPRRARKLVQRAAALEQRLDAMPPQARERALHYAAQPDDAHPHEPREPRSDAAYMALSRGGPFTVPLDDGTPIYELARRQAALAIATLADVATHAPAASDRIRAATSLADISALASDRASQREQDHQTPAMLTEARQLLPGDAGLAAAQELVRQRRLARSRGESG